MCATLTMSENYSTDRHRTSQSDTRIQATYEQENGLADHHPGGAGRRRLPAHSVGVEALLPPSLLRPHVPDRKRQLPPATMIDAISDNRLKVETNL